MKMSRNSHTAMLRCLAAALKEVPHQAEAHSICTAALDIVVEAGEEMLDLQWVYKTMFRVYGEEEVGIFQLKQLPPNDDW